MRSREFYDNLKKKMDEYVHFIYQLSRKFPADELYGATTQIRRAALSIILNFVEGFARQRKAVQHNFFEISYGSLKESKYLLHFALIEKYISKEGYCKGLKITDEIGAMLWPIIKGLENEKK